MSIPHAKAAIAAVRPVKSQPTSESSSFAARESRRITRQKSHSSEPAPMMPVSSNVPSHSSSRIGAFALPQSVTRVPYPSPISGCALNTSSEGPTSAMRPLPYVPFEAVCS